MFGFGKKNKLADELQTLRDEMQTIKNSTQDFGGLTGAQWSEFFSAAAASSGAIVTNETAKRSAAVYACSRLISDAIATSQLQIFERTETGGRKKVEHAFWWLLNESPYPTLTACSFWEWMGASMLMRGDGIAQIIRDRSGAPINFMPIPRQCVTIKKRDNYLIYLVNDGVSSFGLHQDDVLHFSGFGFDGIQGESVIRFAARQAVGTALAADEYSGEFFANGAIPSTIISYPENVAPKTEQQEFLRKQLEERHIGQGKHHKPLILTNGGTLTPVSMTAEDAQLLETRKFQVVEIARSFGVPPHMIGETSASTSWGSGIEQMSMGFVRYTLAPHLKRIEQELNRKLWPRSYKYFVEFNRDSLLSGDSKTESEVFGKALGGPGAQGWMTVNEVRHIKNLEPIAGGDELIFSTQQSTQNEPNAVTN